MAKLVKIFSWSIGPLPAFQCCTLKSGRAWYSRFRLHLNMCDWVCVHVRVYRAHAQITTHMYYTRLYVHACWLHAKLSSLLVDLAGSSSRLMFGVVCPVMMAQIWSAYNSCAGASHVSISEGQTRAVSKEVLVTVVSKDQSLAYIACTTMCVCILCVCVCLCVCACVCVHVCVYGVCVYVCMVCVCAYMHTCACAHVHVCTFALRVGRVCIMWNHDAHIIGFSQH